MREALRQLAVAATTSTVAGRVFDTNGALPQEMQPAPDGTPPPPFVVMVVGPETREADWVAPAWTVTFWPTAPRYSPFTTLDAIVGQLVTGLDQTKIVDGGESFLVRYDGSATQDTVDDDRDLISRAVRFAVEGLVYAAGATVSPDPVAALRAAVLAAFPQLTVSEDMEPTTDPAPAVYFRLGSEARVEPMVGGLGAWHDATLVGHVTAPSFQAVHAWSRRLAEWLSRRTEIALDDDSPMWIRDVALDASANPRAQGQIRAMLRFGTLAAAAGDPGPAIASDVEHVYGRDPLGTVLPRTPVDLTPTAP